MRKSNLILAVLGLMISIAVVSFKMESDTTVYMSEYYKQLNQFKEAQNELLQTIEQSNLSSSTDIEKIKSKIQLSRNKLKGLDFWFRYLEPIAYKKINGPLPVEWETEVFEKFEAPYKREGAGLTLAALYLDEETVTKDSLFTLIGTAINATETFSADSITNEFKSYSSFYLCNRLYLLNLAAIYTTGFECPDTTRIIPELKLMMKDVKDTYNAFNESFPSTSLPHNYLELYHDAIRFVQSQSLHFSEFDHFHFIKDYVSPLFLLNQQIINQYRVVTRSMVDYSLNKKEITIFNKALYNGQNSKGIFLRVTDEKTLQEIDELGKLLFYDPILSGNNQRSCASCHKPTQFFTDTAAIAPIQFNKEGILARNTPSLINAPYNHLLMLDGKHISLQDQTKDVIANPLEMACNEKEVMEKVLSCSEYKNGFKELLKYTPTEKEISFDHIVSAITFYYSKFSKYYSPFDEAMNNNLELEASVKRGFNLFMSKAQCATCHFVPQFNGVKPPYIGSEFEVLGVPKDNQYKSLSGDKGRYEVNPANETEHAFRTGSIRNIAYTAPFMHNGVFKTLDEVIDFYDGGGGAGRGLTVNNQTLSSDSLKLSSGEKKDLMQFIQSLNENIVFEAPPQSLPISKMKALNSRKVGGDY